MGTRAWRIRLALGVALAALIGAAACPVWPLWQPREGGWTRDKAWVPLWEAAAPVVREDARDLHYYVELAIRAGALLMIVGAMAAVLWPHERRDRQDATSDFKDGPGGPALDGRSDPPVG
jgi:hypothetical protein